MLTINYKIQKKNFLTNVDLATLHNRVSLVLGYFVGKSVIFMLLLSTNHYNSCFILANVVTGEVISKLADNIAEKGVVDTRKKSHVL